MILTMFFTALLTLSPATGMRCIIPGTPTVEFRKSKAVFTGKVVGREYIKDENASSDLDAGERLVIKLAVERVWKGEIGDEVLMYTSEVRHSNGIFSMMAEDFRFEDGEQYLVYANGEMKRLKTSACMRTRKLEKAEDDLKELGEGHKPVKSLAQKLKETDTNYGV